MGLMLQNQAMAQEDEYKEDNLGVKASNPATDTGDDLEDGEIRE